MDLGIKNPGFQRKTFKFLTSRVGKASKKTFFKCLFFIPFSFSLFLFFPLFIPLCLLFFKAFRTIKVSEKRILFLLPYSLLHHLYYQIFFSFPLFSSFFLVLFSFLSFFKKRIQNFKHPCSSTNGISATSPEKYIYESRQTDRQTYSQTDIQIDRHTDRQTYRQTEIQIDRYTDRQTYRQTDIHIDRQTDRQTYRQTEIQIDRHTDRQTYRQTNIQTDRHTDHMMQLH